MDIRTNPQTFNSFADIASVTRAGQPVAAESNHPATPPADFDGDRTQLSPAATLISQAASAPAPDVRQEKIDSVRQALAGGTYNVSPSEVAGKLIDHLLGS